MFISRHVVFDETSFPFKEPRGNAHVIPSNQWISIFDSWTVFSLHQTDSSFLSTELHKSAPSSSDLPSRDALLDVAPDSSLPLQISSPLPTSAPISTTSSTESSLLHSSSSFPLASSFSDLDPAPQDLESSSTFASPQSESLESQTRESHDLPEPSVLLESQNQRMVTRSQLGIHKPNLKYAMTVISQDVPREPRSVKSALSHDG